MGFNWYDWSVSSWGGWYCGAREEEEDFRGCLVKGSRDVTSEGTEAGVVVDERLDAGADPDGSIDSAIVGSETDVEFGRGVSSFTVARVRTDRFSSFTVRAPTDSRGLSGCSSLRSARWTAVALTSGS